MVLRRHLRHPGSGVASGLRVFPDSGTTYERLGTVLAAHATGEFIYATPDCPEVTFFMGFETPPEPFLISAMSRQGGRSGFFLLFVSMRSIWWC